MLAKVLSTFLLLGMTFVPVLVRKIEEKDEPSDLRQDVSVRCGVRARSFQRIIGGTAAAEGEFPWMAALMSEEFDPYYFCGGVLVSGWHVLTAAHCLFGSPSRKSIWVRLGENDFKTDDENFLDRRIAEFITHPEYDPISLKNDIALLKFTMLLPFSEFMRPICLPPAPPKGGTHNVYEGKMATVTGWGSTTNSDKKPSVLQKVTVPVWPLLKCKASYNNGNSFEKVICAGGQEGGKDACQGDSGGPLILQENQKFVVIGVVSWGKSCGQKEFPGVYTSVNLFLGWIQENMSK
ncbi:trypsin-1-like [Macrobrachium rosenbergii]|uniref:trypsin-1-like n=1 Tax=Macrobrachium rosenbergii TaxID=79674 RepID=UPI0034D6B867